MHQLRAGSQRPIRKSCGFFYCDITHKKFWNIYWRDSGGAVVAHRTQSETVGTGIEDRWDEPCPYNLPRCSSFQSGSDWRDAIFPRPRLWRDANHDGVSQAEELHTLPSLDVARLHLSFKESKRTDEHGNRFRYRAKVDDARGARAGRWAWDVFLVAGP